MSRIRDKKGCWQYDTEEYQRRYYVSIICPDCGAERQVSKYNLKKWEKLGRVVRCRRCASIRWGQQCRGENNCHWCGGRGQSGDGYIICKIYPDDPYYMMHMDKYRIFEHRLVMARHLGRHLKSNEVVHHLNGVRIDNRIENLVLTYKQDHQSHTLIKALQKRILELEGLS